MKKNKIIYWVFTGIIVLFDSVMPALASNTELAREGISHLGYPDYFRVMLTIFKITGGILLIVPAVPTRMKEWAYAGFGLSFISACISHWMVDGPGFQTFIPMSAFGILLVSYIYYIKVQQKPFGFQLA